ncbi:MAG: phasin family protein [Alphaproteobacteria bacterium]|nr:phasin family protein [Alphaproteobacteria bacterium]
MQASTEFMDKMTNGLIQANMETNAMMRETAAAALESVTALTNGYGEVCDSFSVLMQKTLEHNVKICRAMMSAKNVNDLMDTQSGLIKTGFDSVMTEMGKISQISARIAQQAAEPVANHMNATMTKISQMKAA